MMTKRLLLVFPQYAAEQPIISALVRDFQLDVNIYRARITEDEEGYMVLDIKGEETGIRKGIAYIKRFDIAINETERGLHWDEDRCVSCTNCLSHCPTEALYIPDRKTMKVNFDSDKCIECLSCIANCPYGACSSLF